MFKFKTGDKVRVTAEFSLFLGRVGTVQRVSAEDFLPYEVEFDGSVSDDAASESVFSEYELKSAI